MPTSKPTENTTSLDPADWSQIRVLAHQMLDDALNDIQGIAAGPVWRPMPSDVRNSWNAPLPRQPTGIADVYATYRDRIAPYAVGNRHPQFLGWVHGGGTVAGMLAEMLAGSLNANCGGRDHAPIQVEHQVIRWAAEMLGLPPNSSGLVLSGTSVANLVAVLVARTATLGQNARANGVAAARLTAYACDSAHLCVARAMDMAGLGASALRLVPATPSGAISIPHLNQAIATDRAAGAHPFLVVGTAGSVDIGAIDDLAALATICQQENLWFHIDAAFGAIAMLSPALRPRFTGMEQADSVAFDFHKWAQVPYDAGCIVIRDPAQHRAAFARQANYLQAEPRGLAAGEPWPVDLGPELSRGFRALKVWFTLQTYGADAIAAVTETCCSLAQQFAAAIDNEPLLERTAPVPLNIVCFRAAGLDDDAQSAIAADLQEAGNAVLSVTTWNNQRVLRAAFVNHRTTMADIPEILAAIHQAVKHRSPQSAATSPSHADA
jgi:glutamate/tyrosine decarboxylase-like PLP-dependent enzyme